jgi:hypothetical protein
MTKSKIKLMLKEIVKEVDYDIYKGLFVNPEEPDFAKEIINSLTSIVERYTNLHEKE